MKNFNSLIIGFVIGLISPLITFYLFCRIAFPDLNVWDQFMSYYRRHVITHVISLAVIINLALFFIFLQTNRDQSARGVLGATFVFAFIILILKFT